MAFIVDQTALKKLAPFQMVAPDQFLLYETSVSNKDGSVTRTVSYSVNPYGYFMVWIDRFIAVEKDYNSQVELEKDLLFFLR